MNAGANPNYNVGDLMIIKDQISAQGLAGCHPLVGRNDERFGVRFPAVSPVFDKDLQVLSALVPSSVLIANTGCCAQVRSDDPQQAENPSRHVLWRFWCDCPLTFAHSLILLVCWNRPVLRDSG